jgi:aspartyl-tRNA synthetase
MKLVETMMAQIFEEAMDVKIKLPLEHMTYAHALENYGNDKPDTRFDMKIKDLTKYLSGSEFGVLNSTIENGGRIRGICVNKFFSRKDLKNLEGMVVTFGAKGVMPIKIENGEYKGPLSKFFSVEKVKEMVDFFEAKDGDTVFLIAGADKVTSPSLSKLRLHVGNELGLIDEKTFNFFWLVDPPLVEFDEEAGRFTPVHHPFTAPKKEDLALLDSDIAKIKADAYDLILNGNEIAGGSVRIHDNKMQKTVFEKIGLENDDIEEKFGFMLEAFRYGVPPHAGIAFGLARLLMIMLGCDSIREVTAFPKTTSGLCPMTEAPTEIPQVQLDEVKIMVKEESAKG